MNIDDLKIGDIKALANLIKPFMNAAKGEQIDDYPRIGDAVFIRTVTLYYTGKVVDKTAKWIFLENVAWIANTSRWHEGIATGKMKEVEPYPDGLITAISRDVIVEIVPWNHPLFREPITNG